MDNDCLQFLIATGFGDLQEKLIDLEVDTEVLESLKPGDIDEMGLGLRFGRKRKFLLAIESWRKVRREQAKPQQPPAAPHHNVEEANPQAHQAILDIVDVFDVNNLEVEMETEANLTSEAELVVQPQVEQPQVEQPQVEQPQVEPVPPPTPTPQSNPREITTPPQNRVKFDLEALLLSSPNGQIILSYKEEVLPNDVRATLSDIIIEELLKGNLNAKVSSDMFEMITEQIIVQFPKESRKIYFIPAETSNQHTVAAKGRLVDKYRNKRRTLRKRGLIPKYFHNKKSCLEEDDPKPAVLDSEGVLDARLWLLNSIEPLADVETAWALTTESRLRDLESCNSKEAIEAYFLKFPALRRPAFKNLFFIDFKNLSPGKESLLTDSWPTVMVKIYALVQKKCKKDSKFAAGLKSEGLLPDVDNKDVSLKTVNSLYLLSRLLPIVTSIKGSKKGAEEYRPSRVETQKGFMLRVESEADVDSALLERRNKHVRLQLPLQPIIIIVGALANIRASYVWICGVKYIATSPLDAVNLAYKICCVLKLNFPQEAIYTWSFIHWYIFQMKKVEGETDYPNVHALAADLSLSN